MTLGELFEWLAAAGFTYGTYHATHKAWSAVLCASACLYYLAQGYAVDPIWERKPKAKPTPNNSTEQRRSRPTLHDHAVGTWYRLLHKRNQTVTFWRKRRVRKHQAVVEFIPHNQPEPALPTVAELLVGIDTPTGPDGS